MTNQLLLVREVHQDSGPESRYEAVGSKPYHPNVLDSLPAFERFVGSLDIAAQDLPKLSASQMRTDSSGHRSWNGYFSVEVPFQPSRQFIDRIASTWEQGRLLTSAIVLSDSTGARARSLSDLDLSKVRDSRELDEVHGYHMVFGRGKPRGFLVLVPGQDRQLIEEVHAIGVQNYQTAPSEPAMIPHRVAMAAVAGALAKLELPYQQF